MQTKLDNSNLTLLLPRNYEKVINGDDLFVEMYQGRTSHDIQMFRNLASRTYGNIAIYHIDIDDAMKFGDKDALISEIHENLDDNQGLIEVEYGTNPRGFEYIYSIIKTYHQEELSANYCLRMNIKNGDELIEVNASFFEEFMTGERGSFILNMAWSAGLETDEETHFPKGWFQDPYDPEYNRGSLMIMAERRGFDGLFPGDPLSQARELVLALTEDSYYKTHDEIEAESKKKKKDEKKAARKLKRKGANETTESENVHDLSGESENSEQEEKENPLKQLFSKDVTRAGAYKVDIIEENEDDDKYDAPQKRRRFTFDPADIARTAVDTAAEVRSAVAKTTAEFDKVKVPFEVPDSFRNKLNQPIKEIPGWGKRQYVGFGKKTFAMNALLITWPVSENESMSLTNRDNIIENIRTEHADNQGLVDVKCGITPKGNRYAYIIRKMCSMDEDGNRLWPTQYLLALNIRIDGRIHFIDSSFGPSEELGDIRKSVLNIMQRGSRDLKLTTDQWEKDPFDRNIRDGFLMDWTESEKYDELFPYSPLSELRSFVRFVAENN